MISASPDAKWVCGVRDSTGRKRASRTLLSAARSVCRSFGLVSLQSAALVADGKHARVDGFVSLGVLASAAVVALGLNLADPVIGLVITLVILRITWESWHTVRNAEINLEHIDDDQHHHDHAHE